jgi:hypothetical protein
MIASPITAGWRARVFLCACVHHRVVGCATKLYWLNHRVETLCRPKLKRMSWAHLGGLYVLEGHSRPCVCMCMCVCVVGLRAGCYLTAAAARAEGRHSQSRFLRPLFPFPWPHLLRESLVRDLFRPGPRRIGLRAEDEPRIPGGSRSCVRSRPISRFAERRRRSHWAAQAAQSVASSGASAVCPGVRDASTGKAVQRTDTVRRRDAASNRNALPHRGRHSVGMSAIKNKHAHCQCDAVYVRAYCGWIRRLCRRPFGTRH